MKTSNKILLTALIVVLAGITAVIAATSISMHRNTLEGNGKEVNLTRELPAFKGIKVGGNFTVNLKQDPTQKVSVSADENLQEIIVTEVKDNNLHIYSNKKISGSEKITINIQMADLKKIDGSAGSKINTINTFKTDKLDLEASSGTKLNGSFDANDIKGNVSSGAILNLKGSSQNFSLDGSSGSIANAENLETRKAHINASSGCVLKVHATEELGVDISSGSVVKYKGNPSMNNIQISSGAVLNRF